MQLFQEKKGLPEKLKKHALQKNVKVLKTVSAIILMKPED